MTLKGHTKECVGCVARNEEGIPICLVSDTEAGNKDTDYERDRMRLLYPGQPEVEDSADDTIPASSELTRQSFKPGFMKFWRIDRANFYADVSVRLILKTEKGRKISA